MKYFKDLNEDAYKEIFPGYFGRFIHTENTTIAFWKVTAGNAVPEHNHFHEQIVTVQSGRFELTINGNSAIVEKGTIAIIPPHAKHKGIALTDCELTDIFYPVREDYK